MGFLAEGMKGSAMGFFRPRRCTDIVRDQHRRGEKSAGIGWRRDRASTLRETEGMRSSAMGFFGPRRCTAILRDQHCRGEKSAGIGWRRDRASTLRATVDGATWIDPSIGRGIYASLTAEAMKTTRRAFSDPKPDSSLAARGVAAPQIGSRWTCRFSWVPASTLVQAAGVIAMRPHPVFCEG